ncbi:hypothetical protein [Sporosarcina ureae]|uniref:hypothetical protein n=1 Tax=Sporosarcina ureae TaxID=1571 RepID=UPI0026F0D5B9|nr:hypothetical protein [Sporosarcina ureae]
MQIKHAINDVQSMSHDGGKILQSLQNNYLPLIDIVVRESIQNSLDASIKGAHSAIVDFKIDKFNSEKLAPVFQEIDQKLVEMYPGYQDFLAISDRNTYGLTGNYTSEDMKVLDNSNFHKLVFGIGKNQSQEGAGGSWGYGKTSYFRLGVGVVIYYTRIEEEGQYAERLIASIIEDPAKGERLLENNERGIAWWGELSTESDRIYPITDPEKIKEILQIFGLENYKKTETGTTIIIPYLNKDEKEEVDQDALKSPWEDRYEDAIAMAVQRWYFPRIWNEQYREVFDSTFLECKVNNTVIHQALEFEPVFKIYQELYTSALLGKATGTNINIQPINLGRNALKNSKEEVGFLAFREVSYEEMDMMPPNNKRSGLEYLGVKDKNIIESSMPKVMAYCRKPGMVIEYNINGTWANGNLALKENHILLAFFVPNSNALLTDNFQKAGYKNLESYLRSIETSDHANWEDDVNITIVKRIKERTNQAITNAYQDDKDAEYTSATSGLSRKFGAMLLPPKNFGKTSTRKKDEGQTSNNSGMSKTRGADISVIRSNPKDEETVEVEFKAFIKSNSVNYVFLQVLTQEQRMDANAWLKAIGSSVNFPFYISDLQVNQIDEEMFGLKYSDMPSEGIIFKLSNDGSGTLEITSELQTDSIIEGMLVLKIYSNRYIPNVAIRSL